MERTIELGIPGRMINFKMELDDSFSADKCIITWASIGTYEPEVTWLLFRALRNDDFAIDVGANVGYFTLVMSKLVGPKGRVLACEPGSNNVSRLEKNLKLNYASNVTTCGMPISDSVVDAPFYLSQDDSGGNALWDPALWPENVQSQTDRRFEYLQTITLDKLLVPIKLAPRVIKIDTEGAEFNVITGAYETIIQHQPPYIIAEINRFGLHQMQAAPAELYNLMYSHGYSTFLLQKDGSLPKLVPHGSEITIPYIINVLFSTEKAVSEAWPEIEG